MHIGVCIPIRRQDSYLSDFVDYYTGDGDIQCQVRLLFVLGKYLSNEAFDLPD